jgi:hypothetical protein
VKVITTTWEGGGGYVHLTDQVVNDPEEALVRVSRPVRIANTSRYGGRGQGGEVVGVSFDGGRRILAGDQRLHYGRWGGHHAAARPIHWGRIYAPGVVKRERNPDCIEPQHPASPPLPAQPRGNPCLLPSYPTLDIYVPDSLYKSGSSCLDDYMKSCLASVLFIPLSGRSILGSDFQPGVAGMPLDYRGAKL